MTGSAADRMINAQRFKSDFISACGRSQNGVAKIGAVMVYCQAMSQVRTQTRPWEQVRVCLGCGYGGNELQPRGESAVFVCPCCGDDLYARHPMSYAEMEGLGSLSNPVVIPHKFCSPQRTSGTHTLAQRSFLLRLLFRLRLVSCDTYDVSRVQ